MKHECLEKSPHVIFDEVVINHSCRNEDDDELIMDQEDGEAETKLKDQRDNSRIQGEVTTTTGEVSIINVRELRYHPLEKIIGRLSEPSRTRSHFRMIEKIDFLALLS